MSERKKNHSQVLTHQSHAILPANSRDCWRAHAIAWRVVYQFTKKFDRNDHERICVASKIVANLD